MKPQQWIPLTPRADKPPRKRESDELPPPPPPNRGPMSWRIDPASDAAKALRELRGKLDRADNRAARDGPTDAEIDRARDRMDYLFGRDWFEAK
jgi:hypothetical protein